MIQIMCHHISRNEYPQLHSPASWMHRPSLMTFYSVVLSLHKQRRNSARNSLVLQQYTKGINTLDIKLITFTTRRSTLRDWFSDIQYKQ